MGRSFQPTILYFDSLLSTNTEAARQAASGAPEGLCIVAREQTAGRGRKLRSWSSPMDAGLYFSIVLRPRLATSAWPLITLMSAVAVADALQKSCGIEVDIKWPNDIHARERKLSGILAETFETPQGRASILGIGINLTKEAISPELNDVAISVEDLTGARPERERVIDTLLDELDYRYGRLHGGGGCEETLREWTKRSSYAEGKRVRIALEGETIEGITRGLESDGALRVETFDGKIEIIRAGDVSALRQIERGEDN